MTAHASEKSVVRRPETGWSKARRLRDKGVLRTCLPAVVDEAVTRTTPWGADGNIVRGED